METKVAVLPLNDKQPNPPPMPERVQKLEEVKLKPVTWHAGHCRGGGFGLGSLSLGREGWAGDTGPCRLHRPSLSLHLKTTGW